MKRSSDSSASPRHKYEDCRIETWWFVVRIMRSSCCSFQFPLFQLLDLRAMAKQNSSRAQAAGSFQPRALFAWTARQVSRFAPSYCWPYAHAVRWHDGPHGLGDAKNMDALLSRSNKKTNYKMRPIPNPHVSSHVEWQLVVTEMQMSGQEPEFPTIAYNCCIIADDIILYIHACKFYRTCSVLFYCICCLFARLRLDLALALQEQNISNIAWAPGPETNGINILNGSYCTQLFAHRLPQFSSWLFRLLARLYPSSREVWSMGNLGFIDRRSCAQIHSGLWTRKSRITEHATVDVWGIFLQRYFQARTGITNAKRYTERTKPENDHQQYINTRLVLRPRHEMQWPESRACRACRVCQGCC